MGRLHADTREAGAGCFAREGWFLIAWALGPCKGYARKKAWRAKGCDVGLLSLFVREVGLLMVNRMLVGLLGLALGWKVPLLGLALFSCDNGPSYSNNGP